MELREWQSAFLSSIRERKEAAGLFLAPPAGSASVERRLLVYQQAHRLRIRASLLDDFPLTRRLLGEKRFFGGISAFLAAPAERVLELGALSLLFAAWLEKQELSRGLHRAVELDRLALEARRAPDESVAGGIGLHPSVRWYSSKRHAYLLWREGGVVRRERIKPDELLVLRCFSPRADLLTISRRLEAAGKLDPAWVQELVAKWSALGAIDAALIGKR